MGIQAGDATEASSAGHYESPFFPLAELLGHYVDSNIEELWLRVWTEYKRSVARNHRLEDELMQCNGKRESIEIDRILMELSLDMYRVRVSELEQSAKFFEDAVSAAESFNNDLNATIDKLKTQLEDTQSELQSHYKGDIAGIGEATRRRNTTR